MAFILSIHPVLQLSAILLAYYAGYLGLQRLRSLHFGQLVRFQRERHVLAGAVSLLALLGGFAGGLIIAARFLHVEHGHGHELHEEVAFILLPFLAIGIFTGFSLYLFPGRRKILSAVHGINNLIILVLVLVQIYTGLRLFQVHVLAG